MPINLVSDPAYHLNSEREHLSHALCCLQKR